MIIAHPQYLWLLLLGPLLAWVAYRGADLAGRRVVGAALRTALMTVVVLALSGPLLRTMSTNRTNVLVVDLGPTMPDAPAALKTALEKMRRDAGDDVRVVAFANRAELLKDQSALLDPASLSKLRTRLAEPLNVDDAPSGGSAVAAALQLAGAQVAPEGRGEVWLWTNGMATRGDTEAEAYRLAVHGIAVRVVPAEANSGPGPVVRSVSLPPAARVGQTVAADVVIDATVDGDARITLAAGTAPAVSTVTKLSAGQNSVLLFVPLKSAGLIPVKAGVSAETSTPALSIKAAVQVEPAARVLLVREGDDSSATDALRRVLNPSATVEAITPDQLSDHVPGDFSAVVLADVPADALSADAQLRLCRSVHEGTGLLLTGAARSFGPGGYDDSSMASLLPVRMPQQVESIDPSTTLVLIIDSSGSMASLERIDLAKEIARLAISHLKPHDKVGIVEFYGGKRWAAPIQSAANASIINRALARLTPGGGTTLFPAVEEASFALRSIATRSKHVLILSDGGVEAAPFAKLLRQMAEDGICVSSVALAPTAGEPNMMADLARWGGGRYYSVPDRFALPDITLKQPQVSLLSPVVRRPAETLALPDSLAGLAAAGTADAAPWPAVDGYVRTTAKPTADVLLKTRDGDPLLARWRYGAGFVAVMPTQIGSSMTASLQNHPAFTALLADLFRQIESSRPERLTVKPIVRPAGMEVDVAASDADSILCTGPMKLTLLDDRNVAVRTTAVEPDRFGHWNLLWPGVNAGVYTVTAESAVTDANGRGGVAVLPPKERPGLFANPNLLDRVAGFGPLAAAQAARRPTTIESFFDLRPTLAAAAVVLLLLHVAARRWPVIENRGLP